MNGGVNEGKLVSFIRGGSYQEWLKEGDIQPIIRDLKHQQRNGTMTTGGSKIFPREGSAHLRCCENVSIFCSNDCFFVLFAEKWKSKV